MACTSTSSTDPVGWARDEECYELWMRKDGEVIVAYFKALSLYSSEGTKEDYLEPLRECIQKFPDWVDNEIKIIIIIIIIIISTRWEATQRVMAAKLTRVTHKIALQLHLVAESCTICSSRSRRPVRKLLDTVTAQYIPNTGRLSQWRRDFKVLCTLRSENIIAACEHTRLADAVRTRKTLSVLYSVPFIRLTTTNRTEFVLPLQ
jgi:hypothetical protein